MVNTVYAVLTVVVPINWNYSRVATIKGVAFNQANTITMSYPVQTPLTKDRQ